MEENFFEKNENTDKLPLWIQNKQPLLREVGFLRLVIEKPSVSNENDLYERFTRSLKKYLDISYFFQISGIIAWALVFYFIKYYNPSHNKPYVSLFDPLPAPEPIILYRTVPAFQSGFPVTVSSLIPTTNTEAARVSLKRDISSKGPGAWCANNN